MARKQGSGFKMKRGPMKDLGSFFSSFGKQLKRGQAERGIFFPDSLALSPINNTQFRMYLQDVGFTEDQSTKIYESIMNKENEFRGKSLVKKEDK